MTIPNLTASALRRLVILGALGACLTNAWAQPAPVAATAAQLAKYDTNKNGVLDSAELAAMQAAEAAKNEGTIVLTPFQVSTDKDRGYAAGNTLSGGRADTPLKITSASISVMTREFLDDFAITDMNEAAAWTVGMNAPTGGEGGPFGGNRFQADFRGAGNGANYPARNGALEYFVADSFNTERMEFSRGPNAALFGDAGPGGVQSSSSKQGRFNNRATSVSFRGDTYDGHRSTLDTNFGTDRVALRFNALYQDTKSYQAGTSNKQRSASLAASYKISNNTQLRAEYNVSYEWNILYRKTYAEQASFWNGTTVNNDNTTIANPGTFGVGQINANNDQLTWNFGTNSLINYRGNQYRSVGLGYQIPWEGRPDLPNFKPGVSKSFFLGPADAIADRDLNSRAINFDHRFNPNLFLNLGWVSSDIDPAQINTGGTPGEYRIDLNRLLPVPAGAPAGTVGLTNPNFLKPYSDFAESRQYQSNNVNEFRFNLSYNFDVPKFFQMKQRFIANGGWRQDLYEAWQRAYRRVDNPTTPAPSNGINTLNFRVYWDQPRPNIASVLSENIGGMRFASVATGFAADNNRRLTYGQIVSQTSFLDERVGVTLSFRRDRNQDDVSSNVGFETVAPYNVIMGAQNPQTLVNEAGRRGLLTTFRNSQNAGFVAYPFPSSWGRWISPIGVVANYSQNFSIPSTGANFITGERPTPPVATTKDFGLRYSMPNGVAYATLSHYNTEQVGNIQAFGSLPDFRNIWLNLGYNEPSLSGADFNFRDTNDRKLEGWEVEVTANPSRNVTLTMNYSHPIVTTVSDSPGRRKYYADNLTQFRAGAAATTGTVLNGRTIADPVAIANALQNIENSFNGFTPGTLANNLERHRINVAGSYRFTEGKLRGFAVNGGVNYRAHKKVGSRDAQIKFGTTTPTVLQTAQAGYDYLWVDPTWSTSLGANYTRRFGRYTARFQLNIANVLNDDSPQWGAPGSGNVYSVINANQLTPSLTAGSPGSNPRMQVLSGFTQLDPRKFTFTTTLSF